MNEKSLEFYFDNTTMYAISIEDDVIYSADINSNYHEFIDFINS